MEKLSIQKDVEVPPAAGAAAGADPFPQPGSPGGGKRLRFGILDRPPVVEAILLGFQVRDS
jgi:hypothetical protein